MRRTQILDRPLPPFRLSADGGEGGEGAGSEGAGGGGGGGGGEVNWQSMVAALPAAVRESVPDVETSKDFPSFVVQHRELGALLGKDRVSMLTKDSEPAEIHAFFEKMGRPEKSTDYDLGDFKPKEGLPWDESSTGPLLELLHAAGNNNDQANKILRGYHDYQVSRYEQMQGALVESFEAEDKALRREWGNSYDANMDLGFRAWKQIAGDDFEGIEKTRMQDGRLVGDHPVLMRILAEAGKAMHEHGRLGEGSAAAGDHSGTPAAIRTKIKALQASGKLKDASHPQYAEAVTELNTLIEALGDEPLEAGGKDEF